MASETVDPIDWLHTPPYTGQYPLCSTYCTLQCGLGCKSQDLLHWVRRDRATFGIPDQRTACAATQGISSGRRWSGRNEGLLPHCSSSGRRWGGRNEGLLPHCSNSGRRWCGRNEGLLPQCSSCGRRWGGRNEGLLPHCSSCDRRWGGRNEGLLPHCSSSGWRWGRVITQALYCLITVCEVNFNALCITCHYFDSVFPFITCFEYVCELKFLIDVSMFAARQRAMDGL